MNTEIIDTDHWKVEKIAVVGPGIVGMPMAAMLAHAKIQQGSDKPAKVIVVQRNSPTSGWKVDAINSGKSPIGGIEPELDRIVEKAVSAGLLSASHDPADLRDADVILVCVQTDKDGFQPDYGPMFQALTNIAEQLQRKPPGKIPLIIFESTLAPSTMLTLFKDHFEKYHLMEGRDILMGNSPNRVMPGRLVERVAASDKLIGGLSPATPHMIKRLYEKIVTTGELYVTNSMTAEIVKTLENAYRDVRISYSAEIVRYCDDHNIDFYQVRDSVNENLAQIDAASSDPNAVPSGGLLIPTIGVGGHCLPKDGILMLWRMIETGKDMHNSLILNSRMINDASPAKAIQLAEKHFGDISKKTIALMGTAYRFNSEDTRNSPVLPLAKLLLAKRCNVILHDPYVKPDDQNLIKLDLQDIFTRDLGQAVSDAEVIIFCTAHKQYKEGIVSIIKAASHLQCIVDGCNLFKSDDLSDYKINYTGIGKGTGEPSDEFVYFVSQGFRAMEKGVANEVKAYVDFANQHYAHDDFNTVDFKDVQRIAATCVTGCDIVEPGPINDIPTYKGFKTVLAECAFNAKNWV